MPHFSAVKSRFPSYIELDGAITFPKMSDEIQKYYLDYTEALDQGETISSHAWTAEGATISASVLAGNAVTVTMTGTGDAKLALTLSSGRKIIDQYRWRGIDKEVRDYV